jgi:two-component system response regulator PilR (NtrC family)
MDDYRILIVDDEPDIRELLEITINRMGFSTVAAADLRSAHELLAGQPFHLCLTDMRLPDGCGIDLVKTIQQCYPQTPVAVITAHGSVDTAIESLKAGAFDFLSKPVELDALRDLITHALKLQTNLTDRETGPRLLGADPAVEQLRAQIKKLARSHAPVFINGESGTGKELVARLIHHFGPRASGPFVPVNCGAIPTELVESEFFGHMKGSFTGANTDKIGLFQAADGGTLFLDEVADLPLPMQVKLLRAIQEKAIRPIGGHSEVAIDTRILSATHKDLPAEVEAERFRGDLYYRINVIPLHVPSLRQRSGDIPLLADHFITQLASQWQLDTPALSPNALTALLAYRFPGNIRELENILERAMTLCEGQTIEVDDLQLDGHITQELSTIDHSEQGEQGEQGERGEKVVPATTIDTSQPVSSLEDFLETIEKDVIQSALERCRWNKTEAAKSLGITFRALRYRLKKLQLE